MFACLACGAVNGAEEGALTLSVDGVPHFAIVVAGDLIPSEQTAAMELQSHLEQVIGGEIPIVPEEAKSFFPVCLLVGRTESLKGAFPKLSLEDLGSDGIVMKTKGNDIFLAGGR